MWHLFEYSKMQGGCYFGGKIANSDLHAMLSPVDFSVIILNSLYHQSFTNVTATATIYALNASVLWKHSVTVDVKGNAANTLFTVPKTVGSDAMRFILLETLSAQQIRRRNVYWISSRQKQDVFNFNSSNYTPLLEYADFTELLELKSPQLNLLMTSSSSTSTTFTVANVGTTVAFFVRIRIVDDSDRDILPVFFSDNFITLFPGDKVDISASYETEEENVHVRLEPFSDFVGR